MADYYAQFSEMIRDITEEEKAWIESIPKGYFGEDISVKDVQSFFGMSAKDLEAFDINGDTYDHFPAFACDVVEEGGWWLYCEEHFNVDHIILVVQAFLLKFRPQEVFKMTWADTCSKPRLGAFGGGYACISASDFRVDSASRMADEEVEKMREKLEGSK